MTYDTQGRRVLQGHPSTWEQQCAQLVAEAKALRARVQELEAALTWYRDQHRISGKPTIDAEWAATRLKTDGGARADAALQKQEGE